jgi:hypothetical protein
MSRVFQNIDPSPTGECVPLWCGGRTHPLGGEGGGGSIFWKTRSTALYSTVYICMHFVARPYGHEYLYPSKKTRDCDSTQLTKSIDFRQN